jgi:hypothetical protein
MSSSTTLDFSMFYQLSDPLANRPLRITVRGYSDWVSSEYAWKLFRGEATQEQPIKLGGYMGRQVTEFLWSDLVHIFCVSSSIMESFRSKEITGWSTYSVEVYGRKGELIPGYHGFSVTGGECRRDRSRSQIFNRQAVPGGKPGGVYKGFYFYEEDWDGSDIFRVSSFGGTVVTEKVFKILDKVKSKNVMLIPLPEVEIDVLLDKYDKGT